MQSRKNHLKHLIVDIIKNTIPEWEQHTGNTWENLTESDIELWIENAETFIMENDLWECDCCRDIKKKKPAI